MDDFKNSYDQFAWQQALSSMERAKRVIRIQTIYGLTDSYWENRLKSIAEQFPTLRKEIEEFMDGIRQETSIYSAST